MKNTDIKKIAEKAALKAGIYALKQYDKFDRTKAKLKAKQELFTRVDVMSERIIMKEIKRYFPDHHILSEEAGDNKIKSDYYWIIDPIDGTTNFTMHNPLWAISIGLAFKGKLVLGVVYAPYLDELYVAEKNKGAFMNGKRIRVSNKKSGKILNAFCSGREMKYTKKAVRFFSYQRLNGGNCYLLGSASLELAYVAAGRLESMTIPGALPWDVSAGILLVREAGGKVSDFSGKEWNLKSENMIASNGKIHQELLGILKKI